MQTRNPAKDLPIGIVGSLLACSALYAGLALTLCLMARSLAVPTNFNKLHACFHLRERYSVRPEEHHQIRSSMKYSSAHARSLVSPST